VRGALAVADGARRRGHPGVVLPRANAPEASLVADVDPIGVETLVELARFMAGEWRPPAVELDAGATLSAEPETENDLVEVRGHHALKRALEVAAAGGHNVLMVGPPGSGKSMVARRLPSVMPPLTLSEALEVTRVHSVAGLLDGEALVARRPFRAPHHSISSAGLIGGGSPPSPGEASLAHHGVLFLDELAEFARPALEALRQPLESGSIWLTRGQRTLTFPSRFMLVAATNPCPCGHQGDPRRVCSCHPGASQRYLAKLSGPLIDRIDLMLRVERPSREELMSDGPTATTASIRKRVVAARELQAKRLAGSSACCNADITSAEARRLCPLDRDARATLYQAYERVGLTARGHDRVLRVARTLADLDGSEQIGRPHIAQAVAYREPTSTEAIAMLPA